VDDGFGWALVAKGTGAAMNIEDFRSRQHQPPVHTDELVVTPSGSVGLIGIFYRTCCPRHSSMKGRGFFARQCRLSAKLRASRSIGRIRRHNPLVMFNFTVLRSSFHLGAACASGLLVGNASRSRSRCRAWGPDHCWFDGGRRGQMSKARVPHPRIGVRS